MQQSGGLLLTPVQTLAATIVLPTAKRNRLPYPAPCKNRFCPVDKSGFYNDIRSLRSRMI